MGLDAYLMAERRESKMNVALDSRPTEAVGHVKTGDAELRPSGVCWPIDLVLWRSSTGASTGICMS